MHRDFSDLSEFAKRDTIHELRHFQKYGHNPFLNLAWDEEGSEHYDYFNQRPDSYRYSNLSWRTNRKNRKIVCRRSYKTSRKYL